MKKAISVLFIILTITLLVIIFLFSQDNGYVSGEKSNKITRFILSLFVRDFDNLSETEIMSLINEYGFFIRKLAHFSEYALLGFLFSGSLYTSIVVIKKHKFLLFTISWVFSIFYASSDEYHQSFVDGRGPSIRDVVIDSCGAFTGIMCFLLVVFIYNKYKEKRENKIPR